MTFRSTLIHVQVRVGRAGHTCRFDFPSLGVGSFGHDEAELVGIGVAIAGGSLQGTVLVRAIEEGIFSLLVHELEAVFVADEAPHHLLLI